MYTFNIILSLNQNRKECNICSINPFPHYILNNLFNYLWVSYDGRKRSTNILLIQNPHKNVTSRMHTETWGTFHFDRFNWIHTLRTRCKGISFITRIPCLSRLLAPHKRGEEVCICLWLLSALGSSATFALLLLQHAPRPAPLWTSSPHFHPLRLATPVTNLNAASVVEFPVPTLCVALIRE